MKKRRKRKRAKSEGFKGTIFVEAHGGDGGSEYDREVQNREKAVGGGKGEVA